MIELLRAYLRELLGSIGDLLRYLVCGQMAHARPCP